VNNPVVRRLIAFWPFVVVGSLAVVFALMLTFSRKAPVIASLDPAMAAPGQTVVLSGDYFGRTTREGSLSLAGEIPPPSLIQSWSDQKIVFVVPEDATSGLVTVSNSQGTSTGVLFTNTESIPTVLKAAAEPGRPLVVAVLPAQPVAGQTIELTGRGFGLGDEHVWVQLDTGGGAQLVVAPADAVRWSDRSVLFRWPSGAGSETKLSVVTSRGTSAPIQLNGVGPVSLGDPRILVVEFRARVTVPEGSQVTLWGPVPQTSATTLWSVVSADPEALSAPGSLIFRWPSGSAGERKATYKLSLTSFARKWNGWAAGVVPSNQDPPVSDDRPQEWWKDSVATLKVLSAKWGLSTADPWLRLQRLQTGLAAAFQFTPTSRTNSGLSGASAALLASGRLDFIDAASLAAFFASQSGIPARLVSGLWWKPDDQVVGRTWTEVWLPGGGWISWDVCDGTLGSLDNRHFVFETVRLPPARLLPRSKTYGAAAPVGLGRPSGEVSGAGPLPVVQWEVVRSDK